MNTMMITVCMLLFGASLYAQQESPAPVSASGGFIAALAIPTRINGATGLLVGGGICGIFDDHVRAGLMGAGLVNDVHGTGPTAATRRSITFTYGGVYGEYVITPRGALHIAAYTVLGAGGLLYHGPIEEPPVVGKPGGVDVDIAVDRASDAVFLVEPGLGAELELTGNLRVSAGIGYRFAFGVATEGMSDAAMSGPAALLMLRLGVF